MSTNLPQPGLPLEDYTWEQISAVSRAGLASKYWSIGDMKTWKINNVLYRAQIVGFDHDKVNEPHTIPDAGGVNKTPYPREYAGITFELCGGIGQKLLQGVLSTGTFSFNKTSNASKYNGYDSSSITKDLNNLKEASFIVAAGISDVVVPVEKKSITIDGSILIRIGGDYFFLPSVSELFGVDSTPYNEGEQYALYRKMGLTPKTSTRLIRYSKKLAKAWWTRTPAYTIAGPSRTSAYGVSIQGSIKSAPVIQKLSVAPLFCV